MNFYGTPYEAIATGEEAVALANRLNNATWLGFAEYGLGSLIFSPGVIAMQSCTLDRRPRASPQHRKTCRRERRGRAFSCYAI